MPSILTVAGYVLVGLVAVACLVALAMAVMSKAGRDGLALVGVRLADRLVAFFEHRLTETHAATRQATVDTRRVRW
jgi:hypothetical protein